jgi:hypothetical protein
MTPSFFERVGWQRVRVLFVEASEASRSEANTNTLDADFGRRWHALASRSQALSEPTQILGRSHAARVRIPKLANQQAGKTSGIYSPAPEPQTNRISDEGFANKSFAPPPFDLPVAPYSAHFPLFRIHQHYLPGLRRPAAINLRGHPLSQSFVGPNPVVNRSPSVGAPLLSARMLRSRSGRLGLEDSMHLLVPAVLFWVSWSDKFDANSQSRPPRAQARKPKRPWRSEGLTVVHSDDLRVTILSKQSNKNPFYRFPMLMLQQTNSQQQATEKIPDGQRFHPLSIPGPKPAFEIHSPNVVAPASRCQRHAFELRTPASSALAPTQLEHFQPFADRPRRRHTLSGKFLAQSSRKLATAPTPMPPAHPPDAHQPSGRNASRRATWTPRPIPKTTKSLALETLLPFVAPLATDPKQTTQMRHALLGLQRQLHKLQPPNYREHFFERHASVKGRK